MGGIITDVKAFSENMPFPPFFSRSRLEETALNLERYENTHNKHTYIRVKNLKGTYDSFPVINANFFRLMTLKLLALLLTDDPFITSKTTPDLQDRLYDANFMPALRQFFTDFSSVGSGYLHLHGSPNEPVISTINPQNLEKIVDAEDINCIKNYVLTRVIYETDYRQAVQLPKELRVIYRGKGSITNSLYNFTGGEQIQSLIGSTPRELGVNDFMIFEAQNNKSSREIYGHSDYDSIARTVEAYEIALTLVYAVLVKNVNPIIQVPSGYMEENEFTGQYEFKGMGGSLEVGADNKDVTKYITLDMDYEGIGSYVDKLLSEIGMQSELSLAYLKGEFGSNLSGEALKYMLKSPLDKISRAVDCIEPAIKQLCATLLTWQGIPTKQSDIDIEWHYNIPEMQNKGV